MLQPHNLLILDEPTNHLDMRSKDILKNALKKFKGTVILVSHDREFLNGLVSKVYEFRDGKVREHLGGVYEFLAKRKLENLKELETRKEQDKQEKINNGNSDRKKEWLDRKEQEKVIRKIASQIERAEKEIGEIEAKIGDMDTILSNPNDRTIDDIFFKEYEDLKNRLNSTMHKWEQLSYEMEIVKDED
jgi:ATP-binding cassette, subfamily F, member 3